MQIAIVAALCHAVIVGGTPEVPKTVEACHREIVWRGDEGMGVCNFAQAIIAQWKDAGKFAGSEWRVGEYGCSVGNLPPVLKDAT